VDIIYKGEAKDILKEALPTRIGKKNYSQSIGVWPEKTVKAPNDSQLDYTHIFVWVGSYHDVG